MQMMKESAIIKEY